MMEVLPRPIDDGFVCFEEDVIWSNDSIIVVDPASEDHVEVLGLNSMSDSAPDTKVAATELQTSMMDTKVPTSNGSVITTTVNAPAVKMEIAERHRGLKGTHFKFFKCFTYLNS